MAARKRVDYDRIEAGWRAGLLSPHQLAAAYVAETGEPCSHAAIIKHFKKNGAPRNLGAKIKAKSDAMVTAAMVTEKVTNETIRRDNDIIDDGAAILTAVRLGHRKDINRARGLANKMLDELEGLTDNRDLFEQLGELLRNPDDNGQDRRNDLYQKIIDLPSRSKVMKEMSDTLKNLISLEREAFDIATASKLELTGANGGPIQHQNMDELSDEQLAAIATSGSSE